MTHPVPTKKKPAPAVKKQAPRAAKKTATGVKKAATGVKKSPSAAKKASGTAKKATSTPVKPPAAGAKKKVAGTAAKQSTSPKKGDAVRKTSRTGPVGPGTPKKAAAKAAGKKGVSSARPGRGAVAANGAGAAFLAKAKAAPVRPKTGPYAKDAKFLDEVRELLLAERVIYHEQATSLRAEADSLALEREPGDVQFDEESGEGGTVTVDRERNLALSGQATLAVEEIDDALSRIADKTYGFCERCFQPIPKPRLRALPYARLCVACKSGGLSRR